MTISSDKAGAAGPKAHAASAGDEALRVGRRSLLVGSAGLAAGSVLAYSPAAAQSVRSGQAQTAGHGLAPGMLGNRLYTANPTHPSMADISENPANVPPPITRTEPATIRLEYETIEIEAHLDGNTSYRFWTFNGKVEPRVSSLWAGMALLDLRLLLFREQEGKAVLADEFTLSGELLPVRKLKLTPEEVRTHFGKVAQKITMRWEESGVAGFLRGIIE